MNAATSLIIMAIILMMNTEQLSPYIGSTNLKAGTPFLDTTSLTGTQVKLTGLQKSITTLEINSSYETVV